jgi:aldehyde dehydrogenase (NAD+)/betaine-aldehyde dehydrogenase
VSAVSVAGEARPLDAAMVIGGERVEPEAWLENFDPSTGRTLGRVAAGGAAEIDRAVAAAKQAAPRWAAAKPVERSRLLHRLSRRIEEAHEELSLLETRDTGKPLAQSRADITVTARYFEFYGNVVEAYLGGSIPLGAEMLAITENVPYGTTGHVIPWNYPAQITARSVAPSLAAGNTVVVKPAEIAPLTPVRLAELALEEGLPDGVLNVVPGEGASAGQALGDHAGIGHISFTGSVATGRTVAARCANRGRPVTLELGGKSPHVILESADLDRAIPLVVSTLIQNAGQTCVAGTRTIVHRSLREELIERLVAELESISIGPGLEDPDLGPLISAGQLERVNGFVERAVGEGNEPLRAGSVPPGLGGYFVEPILFTEAAPESEIAQQEVFGPVLVITPFDRADEAVALANATDYGLTAAVWSRDVDQALGVARAIEAGQVFVNGYAAGGGVELPFGGFKDSGFGREKGFEALGEYTQTRTVLVRSELPAGS